jgi:hypothetical protein
MTPLLRDLIRDTAVYESALQEAREAALQVEHSLRARRAAEAAASTPSMNLLPKRRVMTVTPSLPAERTYRERTPEELAARRRCSYCGDPLPSWQEGGQHIPECERLAMGESAPAEEPVEPTLFDL